MLLDINKAPDFIRKALNDQEGIATLHRNIGVVYLQMGLLKQALDYFNKSYDLQEVINKK